MTNMFEIYRHIWALNTPITTYGKSGAGQIHNYSQKTEFSLHYVYIWESKSKLITIQQVVERNYLQSKTVSNKQ